MISTDDNFNCRKIHTRWIAYSASLNNDCFTTNSTKNYPWSCIIKLHNYIIILLVMPFDNLLALSYVIPYTWWYLYIKTSLALAAALDIWCMYCLNNEWWIYTWTVYYELICMHLNSHSCQLSHCMDWLMLLLYANVLSVTSPGVVYLIEAEWRIYASII